jgi:HlyD family secretion protein
MDIERSSDASAKSWRRMIYLAIALALSAGVVYGVMHIRPAAPTIDKASIWTDEVKRGALVREVRGSGSLVPEDIRWISAQTEGHVERIVMHPGARVRPESIILELNNPELQRDVQTCENQLKGAQADFEIFQAQLSDDLRKLKATVAMTRSRYDQAKLQSDVDEQFHLEGLGSELKAKLSKSNVEQLAIELQLAEEAVKSAADSMKTRLAAAQFKVDLQRATYDLKRSKLEALHVRAGVAGILQQVCAEAGQQVAPGTSVARVADPGKLMAAITVAETQAKDVAIGRGVSIDTHNGVVAGRVVRIDPAVVSGTVKVDVEIVDPLPPGARPDMNVDGSIEIENLPDVLYLSRPVQGRDNSTIALFRVVDDGAAAVRLSVKMGRSSADKIEVVEGLKAGDKVITSDMSAWNSFNRINLK